MLVFRLHPRHQGGYRDPLSGLNLLGPGDTGQVPEDADMRNLRKALARDTIVLIRGELEPAPDAALQQQVVVSPATATKPDMSALQIPIQPPVPEGKMDIVGTMTVQQVKADGTFAKQTSPKSSGTNKGGKSSKAK